MAYRPSAWITRHPFVLLLALYAGLAAGAAVVNALLPEPLHDAVGALTGGAGLGAFDPAALVGGPPAPAPPAPMWAMAAVAMVCAAALALPVAWLYTITRAKRGYRQSVVHTLVLLPVIVAGVVVLVKFSLALAFSLAGIVAAVRFRNTLEDSKDAVYIFVATGIGLAAGVELSAAAVLSLLFNVATVALFVTDFGRTPARLEGAMAEERMQRALEMANRSSQFVAALDREVLEDMAPEQLEAIADRAWQRRKDAGADAGAGADGRFDAVLRVTTSDAEGARPVIEAVLARNAKRWRLKGSAAADGGEQVLEYELRLRKRVMPTSFLDAVRRDGTPFVLDADLS